MLKLEDHINSLKSGQWVRVALRVIEELDRDGATFPKPKVALRSFYEDKALTIVNQAIDAGNSLLESSQILMDLGIQLTFLSKYYHELRDPLTKTRDIYGESRHSRQRENIRLLRLARACESLSSQFFNIHLIAENPEFEADADVSATPESLFSWKRISTFVNTLPDEKAKVSYLLQIRRKLIDRDVSGEVWTDGVKIFSGDADKNLLQKLEVQIGIQERITTLTSDAPSNGHPKELPAQNPFTARRKALILLLLTYGRLELPEGLTKERPLQFFHGLIGGDKGKLSDILKSPTAHKDDKRSVNLLCDDLNFARDQFSKLGLEEKVNNLIREIQFLIDDLKED